jgi:hypothetical protein
MDVQTTAAAIIGRELVNALRRLEPSWKGVRYDMPFSHHHTWMIFPHPFLPFPILPAGVILTFLSW